MREDPASAHITKIKSLYPKVLTKPITPHVALT